MLIDQDVPVLIIGAGPCGLALAADLTARGVASMVVETRTEPTAHPRATLLGSRSMEFYRRLGLDDVIIDAGLPTDQGYTVKFTTRLAGKVLHEHGSVSPDDYRKAHREMRTDLPESAWTPYFKVQIGQHAVEPIVKSWLLKKAIADLRYGWQFDSFVQDDTGVTSIIHNLISGETKNIRSRFLVGADGPRSMVRQSLGIQYLGRGAMRRNVSYLFRSREFLEHATVGCANLYFMFTRGAFGVFTNIGNELWNYQHYVLEGNETPEEIDAPAEIRNAMGHDFPFEIVRVMKWSHHQSVAEKYRVGNVFLAGDSAHMFCPTGGIGMNTAIGDAFSLGWRLGASLQGWGSEVLLDSYEWERRPIAFRNTLAAATNADRIDAMMKSTPPNIEEISAEGDAVRERFRRQLQWLSKQFNSSGLHLGYRYAESPVIVADGTPEPPDDPRIVIQSTWPGARAPHIWLERNKSTLDWYDGAGFVLIQFGNTHGARNFEAAAAELGIPLRVEYCEDPQAASLYEKSLVLVRPDGHVCWRGDTAPASAYSILRVVTGKQDGISS